jgi:4-hydroxy-3-polyprenylbenzoate decarboxylase
MLIDATQKYPMAPLALPRREYMEGSRKIWEELGLPPLTVKSPWHGYTLGDWTQVWETFARRATQGDWEQNGVETLARTRPGLQPETPVGKVEPPQPKID